MANAKEMQLDRFCNEIMTEVVKLSRPDSKRANGNCDRPWMTIDGLIGVLFERFVGGVPDGECGEAELDLAHAMIRYLGQKGGYRDFLRKWIREERAMMERACADPRFCRAQLGKGVCTACVAKREAA